MYDIDIFLRLMAENCVSHHPLSQSIFCVCLANQNNMSFGAEGGLMWRFGGQFLGVNVKFML